MTLIHQDLVSSKVGTAACAAMVIGTPSLWRVTASVFSVPKVES